MAGSGGKIKASERHWARLDEARARELYDAGCSDPEIARLLGVSPTAPFHWRRRNGLPAVTPRDRGLKSEVVRLMQAGFSDRDIAEKIGCGRSYPRVIRRRFVLGEEAVRERNRRNHAAYFARHSALIGRG